MRYEGKEKMAVKIVFFLSALSTLPYAMAASVLAVLFATAGGIIPGILMLFPLPCWIIMLIAPYARLSYFSIIVFAVLSDILPIPVLSLCFRMAGTVTGLHVAGMAILFSVCSWILISRNRACGML